MPNPLAAHRKVYQHQQYLHRLTPSARAKALAAFRLRLATPVRSDRKNAKLRAKYQLNKVAAAAAQPQRVDVATQTLAEVDDDEIKEEGSGWSRKFAAAWWAKLFWWTLTWRTVTGSGHSTEVTGMITTRATAGSFESSARGSTASASGQHLHCKVTFLAVALLLSLLPPPQLPCTHPQLPGRTRSRRSCCCCRTRSRCRCRPLGGGRRLGCGVRHPPAWESGLGMPPPLSLGTGRPPSTLTAPCCPQEHQEVIKTKDMEVVMTLPPLDVRPSQVSVAHSALRPCGGGCS